jgi:hypothetical protein
VEFPPIEAPPEPILGPDDHHSRDPEPPPVFGATERPPMREPPAKPAIRLGKKGEEALKKIIWGATLRRECPDCEEHHLFPRQKGLRRFFERTGVEVDDWAILISVNQHREAHRRDGNYGAGGKWNWDWGNWWQRHQDEQVEADDVFVRALEMIREYKLEPYGLPIQYGYGRVVSQDLYDVIEPAREVR